MTQRLKYIYFFPGYFSGIWLLSLGSVHFCLLSHLLTFSLLNISGEHDRLNGERIVVVHEWIVKLAGELACRLG